MISAALILEAINNGFLLGIEALKFMQTDSGKLIVTKAIEDAAARDAFFAAIGKGINNLFTGKLFQ